MRISNARRLLVAAALMANCTQMTFAAGILIGGARSQPESLTMAPNGVLIVGSASSPFNYMVSSGSTSAALKLRWDLPGEDGTCSEFAIGPDEAFHKTDAINGKIFRLPAGAFSAEAYLRRGPW